MNDAYIFSDHDDDAERRRLQMLEQVHDPRTAQLLMRAKLRRGQACAEIGAGAGSIAGRMARSVGPTGRVVAVDIDPRFLASRPAAKVEVRQADITKSGALERESYDLVHARFLLVHLVDSARAISCMVEGLKPGGVLILEEPDFRTAFSASGNPQERTAIDAVNCAICALYVGAGKDPGFGIRLPKAVEDAGICEFEIDVLAPVVRGGDPMALMMGASVFHLRHRLVQTGAATLADIDRYCAAATDRAAWASYYSTISVMGWKSGELPGRPGAHQGGGDA